MIINEPSELTRDLLVSVIIPSFQRPKETLRAVKSALLQDYTFLEVIVVDDNGANSSASIETRQALSDFVEREEIKYISHLVNLGGNAARNTGLMAAQGRYIAFLDSDDEFLPFKISIQVNQLLQLTKFDPMLKAVTCNRQNLISGKILSETEEEGLIDNPFPILSLDVKMGAGSTILFDRECLATVGVFDESLVRHQEVEFLLRYLKFYKVKILSDVLVRIHMDDRSNIPKTRNFIKNKEYFLSKMSHTIYGLLPRDQRKVFMMHYLEVSKVAIRNKDFMVAILYFFKAKPNIQVFLKFVKEVFTGVKTYLFNKSVLR